MSFTRKSIPTLTVSSVTRRQNNQPISEERSEVFAEHENRGVKRRIAEMMLRRGFSKLDRSIPKECEGGHRLGCKCMYQRVKVDETKDIDPSGYWTSSNQKRYLQISNTQVGKKDVDRIVDALGTEWLEAGERADLIAPSSTNGAFKSTPYVSFMERGRFLLDGIMVGGSLTCQLVPRQKMRALLQDMGVLAMPAGHVPQAPVFNDPTDGGGGRRATLDDLPDTEEDLGEMPEDIAEALTKIHKLNCDDLVVRTYAFSPGDLVQFSDGTVYHVGKMG